MRGESMVHDAVRYTENQSCQKNSRSIFIFIIIKNMHEEFQINSYFWKLSGYLLSNKYSDFIIFGTY